MKSAAVVLVLAILPAPLLAQTDTTHAGRAPQGGGEHSLRASEVPAAVREAFRRDYPHAAVRGYSTEVEHGRRIYEVQSRDGSVGRDISYGADGSVLETETSVPVAELPAAVRSAITSRAGSARIARSERLVAGADTVYEFTIQGRRGAVRLRADGTPAPAEQP